VPFVYCKDLCARIRLLLSSIRAFLSIVDLINVFILFLIQTLAFICNSFSVGIVLKFESIFSHHLTLLFCFPATCLRDLK
jgi:hypothetical protein